MISYEPTNTRHGGGDLPLDMRDIGAMMIGRRARKRCSSKDLGVTAVSVLIRATYMFLGATADKWSCLDRKRKGIATLEGLDETS